MNRYIDAEWLLGVAELSNGVVDVDDIYNAPSIDIVRCRECKWFDKDNLEDTYCTWSKGLCDAKPDDFCSYGERSSE